MIQKFVTIAAVGYWLRVIPLANSLQRNSWSRGLAASTSVVSFEDHPLSPTLAALGHSRAMKFDASTNSLHMQTSTPPTKPALSAASPPVKLLGSIV